MISRGHHLTANYINPVNLGIASLASNAGIHHTYPRLLANHAVLALIWSLVRNSGQQIASILERGLFHLLASDLLIATRRCIEREV